MFKRAVMTDEISQDFERAVEICTRFRLEGVELRSVWDKAPQELSDAEIDRIRGICRDAGMGVPCIAAPVFKCKLYDESEYREHIGILKRCIEIADALGARLIRGFTFWAEGEFESSVAVIVEKIRKVEPMLRESGHILVIEYDPATSASNTQKLETILRQVASDHIQALFDPGNNVYDLEGERPYPEGYERMKPWLAHVHVKDITRARRNETGVPEAVAIGSGDVGFADLFRALVRDGYDGWASLETHYRIAAPISDELLHRPKGSAFSAGGEEASIECLIAWENMLRDIGVLS